MLRIKRRGDCGGFLTFEGFEPLDRISRCSTSSYDLGLRMASLSHSRRNPFADGIGQIGAPTTGGLTDLGRRAVRRMNELGIVVDLAHLNSAGCWEVLELSEAPVVLSHCQTRRYFAAHPTRAPRAGRRDRSAGDAGGDRRQRRGGRDHRLQPAGSDRLRRRRRLRHRAVGPDHVGLGTDFFGIERAPDGFTTMAELPNVTAELMARGHGDDVVRKVLGENYLRVFRQVWR